jgi:SSS family solute:Na+ symporter
MWPHLFMKAYTARDNDTLRRTVVLFPTFQIFLVPLLLVGFAGVLFSAAPEGGADFILPHMVLETGMPALVIGLFCAGALAASMSTGDALLHGAASIAIEDGIAPFVKLTDSMQRLLMRVLVVAVGGVAYWFTVQRNTSLVQLLLGAYGLIDQLAPPIYATLYWRRATTPGVVAGLAAGAATSLFFYRFAALRPYDIHEGILGLFVNIPVLVIVSLLTRRQDEDHVASFVDASEAATADVA